jgi:hypothetical protein
MKESNTSIKGKQPHLNMGRRPEYTFLKRRHSNSHLIHEKMLNITI